MRSPNPRDIPKRKRLAIRLQLAIRSIALGEKNDYSKSTITVRYDSLALIVVRG